PMVIEGVLALRPDGGQEAVLLGFIPHDERRVTFNLAFAEAVSVLQVAKARGGRAYSTGVYFPNEAPAVLGSARLARLREFQKNVDPRSILNPGKVTSGGAVAALLGIAQQFEPLIRPFANAAKAPVGERIPEHEVAGLPGDVAWYAYACSQCGYCVDDCDQFYGRGWESQSPRGKWYFLRHVQEGKAKWDQDWVDTFMVCTTCELCNVRCCLGLPIEPSWLKLRGKLIEEEKRMTIPPFEMMSATLGAEGNIWAGYRKNRTDWFPKVLWEKHGPDHKSKNVYFAGCTASYVEHDIGQAAVRLMDTAGVDFTYLGEKENCCATPMLVAGKWEQFTEIMRENIAAVKTAGADTVIASCPACDMMWRKAYPEWCEKLGIDYGLKVRHYSEVVGDQIAAGAFSFPAAAPGQAQVKVTWHDSCHIGRASGVYEPPRDLIKAVPGAELVEMEFNRRDAHCCGSVLTLLKDPLVAHDIGKMRLAEADATGAEKILALCPCCQFQLRV
ncbi:MAG TPA: (Fe-S)-binding protein, partial [Candidatus Limnocylindrales bacterium]